MSVTSFIHRFEPGTGPHASTTLLLLHGTGGDESDLVPLGHLLLPGAALLSPRGRVLENGMPRFFRRLAEGVFDLDDLRARTTELAAWVRAAAAHYKIDPWRIHAVGFSNGANMAASLHLLEPDVLAGSVLLRAMVPIEPETPPSLAGKRIFLSNGLADPMISAAGAERLATLLRDAGAEVTQRWERGGHALAQGDVDAASKWLAEVT